MGDKNHCINKNQLLDAIRAYNFAIIDVGLFLDTNPNCEQALNYYHTYHQLYNDAVEMYQKHFGPLTIFGNECEDKWEWTCAPWPWELEG